MSGFMKCPSLFTFDSSWFEDRCSNVDVVFEFGWIFMFGWVFMSPDSSGNKDKHV